MSITPILKNTVTASKSRTRKILKKVFITVAFSRGAPLVRLDVFGCGDPQGGRRTDGPGTAVDRIARSVDALHVFFDFSRDLDHFRVTAERTGLVRHDR